MKVEFDPRRPAGSRVLSITVGDAPLDADKTYRVAVNDFMARGGDGYPFAAIDPLVPLEDTPLLVGRGDDLPAAASTACKAASTAA